MPTYFPCPDCGETTWPYEGDLWTCNNAHRNVLEPNLPAAVAPVEHHHHETTVSRRTPVHVHLGAAAGTLALILHFLT